MQTVIKKKIRKDSNINSLMILLFFGFIIVFSLLSTKLAKIIVDYDTDNYNYVLKLLSFIFQYVINIPILIIINHFIYKKDKIKRPYKLFYKPQMPAKWIIKWIFITIGMTYMVNYLSNVVFSLFQMLTGIELYAIDLTADNAAIDQITNIVTITFLAPFFEEIFFRGVLFKNVEKHNIVAMIMISGVIFGLWHMNYSQTLYTATLGICSCFLVAKTKSIFPSIIAHFVLNLLGCIQSLFVGDIDQEKLILGDIKYFMDNIVSISIITITGVIALGLAITGLILFILEMIKHKESFKFEQNEAQLSSGKTAVIYLTAPLTIITLLLMITVTIYNAITI